MDDEASSGAGTGDAIALQTKKRANTASSRRWNIVRMNEVGGGGGSGGDSLL